jgi:G:T-mismatch repair DNA endonuclease (very short patch repair protein)
LKRQGFQVLTFWQCECESGDKVATRLARLSNA